MKTLGQNMAWLLKKVSTQREDASPLIMQAGR